MDKICTDCCIKEADIECLKAKILHYENIINKMKQEKLASKFVGLITSKYRHKKLDADGSGELL